MEEEQEWEPVLPNESCLSAALQRACVAAVQGGFVAHLLKSLHESGFIGMTEGFITFVGADCGGLWGVANAERKHCFHCARPQRAGELCSCIEGSLPRDFLDLNDEAAVAAAEPAAPARTFLCSDCGHLAVVSCGEVARAQAARGVWYPHTRCGRCHGAARKAAGAPRRAPKRAKPARQAPRTNLGQLLREKIEAVASNVAQA